MFRNNSLLKLSLLGLAFAQGTAHAGLPSVYKKLPDGIRTPEGVSLVAALDDNNPKVASNESVYYLPLNQEIEISNYTWSPLVTHQGRRGGFCQHIDNNKLLLQKLSEKQIALLEPTSYEKKRIDDLLTKKRALETTIAEKCVAMDIADGLVKDLREQLESEKLALRLADASRLDKIKSGMTVQEVNTEFKSLGDNVLNLQKQLDLAQMDWRMKQQPCLQARKSLEYNDSELATFEVKSAQRTELNTEINNLKESMVAFKDAQGREVSGGDISGIWDDGFSNANKKFSELNNNVTLRRLPQKQLNFYIRNIDNTVAASLLLSFTASGNNLVNTVDAQTPSKDNPRYATSYNATDNKETNYFSLIQATPFRVEDYTTGGNSGAYDATLSIFGACAILEEQESGRRTSGLVLSSTALYPSSARTRVEATYNLYKMLEKFEEKGTKKTGFLGLNKEAFHNAINKSETDEDFKFEFHPEDVGSSIDQDQIRNEIKAELMTRVATALGSFDTKMPDLSPEPAANKINVPFVKVNYLFNFFPIKVFDFFTIFGDTKTTAELKSKLNVKVKETWDYNRIVPQVNTVSITFKMPKR